MKKILIICIVFAIYKNWSSLTGYAETNEVVLYSTDWCGYCKKARSFFNDNNIKFQEFDIERSDDGRRRYDALGGSGIPLILINGDQVNGYNKAKIIKLLE